ncbi:hypothetical protein [Cryobacterium sp. PH31-O1]|uniref:hypothetical protein n=1 Tax=Cryobacterium sp. PH31-O1 TaxID=3046306 RepID=UPI0024B98D58|nr:hypothetical protein [Cryobacterium sp. PH31-O1]MDJ0336835.1 hypothetical protein [Cryobacterium sp. PH31-O1]
MTQERRPGLIVDLIAITTTGYGRSRIPSEGAHPRGDAVTGVVQVVSRTIIAAGIAH